MIHQFTFNHYEVNCYVVVDVETRRCAIVDPASETTYEDDTLAAYLTAEGLTPVAVLLTHAHVDHIAGLRQVCGRWNLPVTMHAEGRPLLRQAEAWGAMMGFAVDAMDDLEVVEIEDGQVLHVGNTDVECRYVPGHCPGSMCFVIPEDKAVITGDALFHYDIGRTDLPGGSYPLLIEKLKSRVLTLPDDYTVMPGHGIRSRVGRERSHNPYLQ